MPSWYNLFFATFGIAALMRHLETGRARWLVAGRRGRRVFLPRQVGGPVLHRRRGPVSRRERGRVPRQAVPLPGASPDASIGAARPGSIAAKAALAVVLVGSVAWLVRTHSNRVALLHFVVPVAAVSGFLVWSEIAWGRRPLGPRLVRLCRLVLPFLAGVAIPIAVFLIPYARTHALGDFYRGVFIAPQQRLSAASAELPPWLTVLPLMPYALILVAGGLARRIRFGQAAIGGVRGVAGLSPRVFRASRIVPVLWNLGRHLNTAAVVAGVVLLARGATSMSLEHSRPAAADGRRRRVRQPDRISVRRRDLFLLHRSARRAHRQRRRRIRAVGAPAAAPRHRRAC